MSLLFGILFAIIFDLPPPIEHMPIPYLNKIENSVIVVVEASMQGAADELHYLASTSRLALIAHGRHEASTQTWDLGPPSLPTYVKKVLGYVQWLKNLN